MASEGITATPDQSLDSSCQKSAREVIGQITEWLPLVQMEERLPCLSVSRPPSSTTTMLSTALPWCPAEVRCVPSSSAGWRTTTSPTCSRSSWASTPRRRSSSPSSPRWRTRRSPIWTLEALFQAAARTQCYAHGNYAHKTKQTMPNRP